MTSPDCGYGRVRPNPSPLSGSPRLERRLPAMRRPRSRPNCALPVLAACFLVLLAGCSTMPQGPEVVGRPRFEPPRLVPPQMPEALPDPVKAQRTIWRHDLQMPSRSSA